ncbi:MAG TPA: hypothetical protein VIU12_11000 [Chryseolinea sp.]
MNFQKHTTTLIFLLLTSISYGQTQVLKKYHFEDGGYYLIGLRGKSDPNVLADSLGNFYTDEIKVLNAIKKAWVFKKPGLAHACGYHYVVSVCRNGLELERFGINLNCNEFFGEAGQSYFYFYFETRQLRKFKDSFKKPFKKTDEFTSVTEARNYRKKILKDPNFIFTYPPDWIKYEGTFRFTYYCTDESQDCYRDQEKLFEKFADEIKLKYPGEPFEFEFRGGSKSQLSVDVLCNKSLEEKFTLYKRNPELDKWRPYILTLDTFWTVAQENN